MAAIYRLQGIVKQYDWGGSAFIPSLLNIPNKENKPFAEYWMGTHAAGISSVEMQDGSQSELLKYVTHLPYLLKVLDVRNMLSIQVHPSKKAAEKEFAKENKAGIPIASPQRNYKDDNHKPELMVALSDFWLLHGFKPREQMVNTLMRIPALTEFLPLFNEGGYTGLYQYIMEMPQEEVNRILQPVLKNIPALYDDEQADKSDANFWAIKANHDFSQNGNIDRGIFSFYLFNIVHLKKGEGIFQDAGVPHAYLEGQNVEIMATSDNVLRGGLTNKHIDVKELMKHIVCEPTEPEILLPEVINSEEKVYPSPAPDFQLSVFNLEKDKLSVISTAAAEIFLLTEGSVTISSDTEIVELHPGSPAAIVLAGSHVTLNGMMPSIVYRAAVPGVKVN